MRMTIFYGSLENRHVRFQYLPIHIRFVFIDFDSALCIDIILFDKFNCVTRAVLRVVITRVDLTGSNMLWYIGAKKLNFWEMYGFH